MPESPPTQELDLQLIKSRSARGVASLVSRSLLVQLISSLGFFFLTVFLGRSDIGLFFAVTEIIAILGYFSDIGLAASLIQKKDPPDKADLRTTFTVQQVLVVTLIIIALVSSPLLQNFFNLTPSGVLLLYALLAGFFLASLKTIPSILLERSLRFDQLAIVEVLETVIFYALAVTLAKSGAGVASYTYAVLARGLVGTLALYLLNPWPIGLAFSKHSLGQLLKFGIPYQLNTFLAVIKDRFTTVLLFKIIGSDGLGILGWAQTWSQKPLRLVMDNVTKVTFPAISRLQDNPEARKKALEKSLFFSTSLIFPILIGFAILVRPLMTLIPRYSKWEIALTPLYIYLFSSTWAAISTPLTNALNAIGKIRYTFYLMIMWTALTLILLPFLALKYGFLGVAYGTGMIAFTSVVPIFITKKFIPFSLTYSTIKPLLASLVMGVFVWLVLSQTTGILGVTASLVVGLITYVLALFLLYGRGLFQEITNQIKNLKKTI